MGVKRVKAVTTGSERTRLSIAVCAAADGYKLPIVVIFPRVNTLKDFNCPDNIIVVYKTKPTFDSLTIKESFVERVLVSHNRLRGIRKSVLVLDHATCHTTSNFKESLKVNNVDACFIPKRFTNLLQPADVAWFKPFKAQYTEKWNNWFLTSGNKTFTKNGNMRSPGYVQSIKWLLEIWADMDPQIIIESFQSCGILEQNEENYHKVLKKILNEGRMQNIIDDTAHNEAFFNEYSEADDDNEVLNRQALNDGDEDGGNYDVEEGAHSGEDSANEDAITDDDDVQSDDDDEDEENRIIDNILDDQFDEEGDLSEEDILDKSIAEEENNVDENNIKRRLRKRNY